MNYIGAGRFLKEWRPWEAGGGGDPLNCGSWRTTFFSQHGTFARKFNTEALARGPQQ